MWIRGLFVTSRDKRYGWLKELALHLSEVSLGIEESQDGKHAAEKGGSTSKRGQAKDHLDHLRLICHQGTLHNLGQKG